MDKKKILDLRKSKRLHPEVEERLIYLFNKISPDDYTLKEGYGVTSGRTDTTTYLVGKGKIIHTEIFASESTVHRDLTNLHQSSADLCIAVVMDREVDPKIAESFFRANAKAHFSTLWISDILDTRKEKYTIGRLEEIIRNLDRQMVDLEQKVIKRFEVFIKNLEKPDETQQMINCGVFPRRFLNLFSDSRDEDELFKVFERMEANKAANPFKLSLAYDSHFFSHGGQFLTVRQGLSENPFFTQVAIGNSGEIILSLGAERERGGELCMSTVKEAITPTLKLCDNVFKKFGYDGMAEIIVSLIGLKDMKWIAEGQDNRVSRMIRGRRFYSDDVSIPIQSFSAIEIFGGNTLEKFFNVVDIELNKNTRKIPISA